MDQASEQRRVRYQATRRVTLVGALVNLLLAVSKTAIGVTVQSHALVADGIHSFSDLLSDALVYFAAKNAHHGPDRAHPYGHSRYETAATLGLGTLLGLVALGIVWDAGQRLFDPASLLVPGSLAIYAALFSIMANEALYRYTARVATQLKSEMLLANAWHHRSDAFSSIVVLIGVAGTMAGLPYLDAIAAAVVGLMIGHIGWNLAWPAFQELVDEGVDQEGIGQIRHIITQIGGVQALHTLRTRKMAGQVAVDVHILVEPWMSVSEGHMISQQVIDQLLDEVDNVVDVTVHIDPEDDERGTPCKGLPLRLPAESLLEQYWAEISAAQKRQRVMLHYLEGKIDVDVYFCLDDFPGIDAAEVFERQLKVALAPSPAFGNVRVYYGGCTN